MSDTDDADIEAEAEADIDPDEGSDDDAEQKENPLAGLFTTLTAALGGLGSRFSALAPHFAFLNAVPISWPAFGQGMGANGGLLVLLIAWAWFQSGSITVERQERLASKTAVIEQEKADSGPQKMVYQVESIAIKPSSDIARNKDSLVAAPVQGLYESVPFGVLPQIRQEDGVTPFDAYKRPFTHIPGKPKIAIAIFDLGLSAKATESAIRAMPKDVSLIFTPYTKGLDMYRQKARAAGHEIWMSLPMENKTYPNDDPGSQAVLVSASLQRNQDHILWGLSRTIGYAGVVSGKDHKFINQHLDGHPLMDQVLGRGLGFIESNPANTDFGAPMAKEYNAPYAKNDAWIDETLMAGSIVEQLRMLELKALKDGEAIGFIRPYPVSYQIVLKWASTLKGKGIDLAPLSAVSH